MAKTTFIIREVRDSKTASKIRFTATLLRPADAARLGELLGADDGEGR